MWFYLSGMAHLGSPGQRAVKRMYVCMYYTHLTASFPLFIVLSYRRWRGVVVSGVRRMNEVNARRARLVPGWVTVFWRVYHLGM